MAGELTTTITFADGDQVTSAKLNEIISGASFTASAVTGTTLTVVGGKLKVGTVTASELGSSSVTEAAIADDAVTADKLADDAVGTSAIQDLAVGTAELANSAVTYAKMNSTAIPTKSEMEGQTASKLVTASGLRYSPAAAKACGSFAISSSARPITAGYNVASVTRLSSTETKVTFTDSISPYVVMLTVYTDGTTTASASVSARAVTDFTIKHPAEAGTSQHVGFLVFGTLL